MTVREGSRYKKREKTGDRSEEKERRWEIGNDWSMSRNWSAKLARIIR